MHHQQQHFASAHSIPEIYNVIKTFLEEEPEVSDTKDAIQTVIIFRFPSVDIFSTFAGISGPPINCPTVNRNSHHETRVSLPQVFRARAFAQARINAP